MGRLELCRAEPIQGRVDANPVVEALDVLEERDCGLPRLSNVRAYTHSDLMTPIRDSAAALSHGKDIEPIDGLMPFSRIVLPRSKLTYWARGLNGECSPHQAFFSRWPY